MKVTRRKTQWRRMKQRKKGSCQCSEDERQKKKSPSSRPHGDVYMMWTQNTIQRSSVRDSIVIVVETTAGALAVVMATDQNLCVDVGMEWVFPSTKPLEPGLKSCLCRQNALRQPHKTEGCHFVWACVGGLVENVPQNQSNSQNGVRLVPTMGNSTPGRRTLRLRVNLVERSYPEKHTSITQDICDWLHQLQVLNETWSIPVERAAHMNFCAHSSVTPGR